MLHRYRSAATMDRDVHRARMVEQRDDVSLVYEYAPTQGPPGKPDL